MGDIYPSNLTGNRRNAPPSDAARLAFQRGFLDPVNMLDEMAGTAYSVIPVNGYENVWNSRRRAADILSDNIDKYRAVLKADERDHPFARNLGQVSSSLLATRGRGALRHMLKWGGITGGLAGFGEREGNIIDRLPGAVFGAGEGLAAAYFLGRGLERAFRAKPRTVEDFLKFGFDREAAEHMAKPYGGIGHHWLPTNREVEILRRKIKFPEKLSSHPWLRFKPKGMNNGDFWIEHFKVDPQYGGNSILNRRGPGFSPKKLGFEKYVDKYERAWRSAPSAVKKTADASMGAVGTGAYLLDKRSTQPRKRSNGNFSNVLRPQNNGSPGNGFPTVGDLMALGLFPISPIAAGHVASRAFDWIAGKKSR